MMHTKSTMLAATAYITVVSLAVLGTPRSSRSEGHGKGQPSGPDVRVVNTPSEPVPVALKGTGNITGDVQVVNSPTVKIAPGAKVGIDPACDGVTIRNSTSQPVPIAGTVTSADEPARSPYQDGFGFEVANSITSERALQTVPNGKQMVIEYFSATASVPAGQSGFFFIKTRAGGTNAVHVIPVSSGFADAAIPGSDLLVAAQPIRIYADAGTTPSVSFRRNTAAGTASFSAFTTGYLVSQ